MTDRALGNPLGNPLGLAREASSQAPEPLIVDFLGTGAGEYRVPHGYRRLRITVVGAGGGGRFGTPAGYGGGGGGGGLSQSGILDAVPGSVISYYAGKGKQGLKGEDSYAKYKSVSLLATGGAGGVDELNYLPKPGGTGFGGLINRTGGFGANGAGSGGGGAAGTTGDGGDGSAGGQAPVTFPGNGGGGGAKSSGAAAGGGGVAAPGGVYNASYQYTGDTQTEWLWGHPGQNARTYTDQSTYTNNRGDGGAWGGGGGGPPSSVNQAGSVGGHGGVRIELW